MIYTVTLNPSVDLFLHLDKLVYGEKNITDKEIYIPGGKALNVSRILSQIGLPTVATGFSGGFQGAFIENWLRNIGIRTDFVQIKNENRTNIKLIMDQTQTLVNAKGPIVSDDEVNELIYYLSRVGEGDTVVMSGSVPIINEKDIYGRMIAVCRANKANFVIDIPAEYLLNAIKQQPLLVKPNEEDLEKMFNVKMNTTKDLITYGIKIIDMGAKNSIVSLGEKGALFFNSKREVYKASAIKGEIVNTIACRDAMIGAFVGMYMKTSDPLESFRVSVAAASATALVYDLPDKEFIEKLSKQVEVERLQ